MIMLGTLTCKVAECFAVGLQEPSGSGDAVPAVRGMGLGDLEAWWDNVLRFRV